MSITKNSSGYILLRCANCGMFFKLRPKDMQNDSILNVFCPGCGLIIENYIAENLNFNETVEKIYPKCFGIETLETVIFQCCNKSAKIKSILAIAGCYCVFCGEKNYEFK